MGLRPKEGPLNTNPEKLSALSVFTFSDSKPNAVFTQLKGMPFKLNRFHSTHQDKNPYIKTFLYFVLLVF